MVNQFLPVRRIDIKIRVRLPEFLILIILQMAEHGTVDPVVQGKDNEEYLHKTFSANENTLGTIFLNVDNNANFLDENSLIYGHYMNDGSMFRHLASESPTPYSRMDAAF